MKPIRLAINAWSLVSTHTGIASYTRNLALALQRSGEVEINLFYGVNWSAEVRSAPVPGWIRSRRWSRSLFPSLTH